MILAERNGCFMVRIFVLSVGLDPELLDTRKLVLQSAGYTVGSAYTIKEAVDRLQAGDFDLVLLCQSIPTKDRERLICWIRASGSRIPVVSVAGKLRQSDPFADVTVGSEPEALLSGINKVLNNLATPQARTTTYQDKQEAAAAPGKEPPRSSDSYERQTKAAKQHPASFERTG